MEVILSTLINGLSLGGIYAMIALGYTMVYGIAKMLNFAHGDVIMVGAYLIYVFMATNSPLLAIVAACVGCVILGVVIEKVAYKPLRGASPLAVLITAIGVSYLLQSLAQIIFGSAPKMVTVFDFGAIQFLGARVQVSALVTLGVTVVVMTALTLFVKYTRLGRAMVAVSEDKSAAQLMGINVNGIITITFAIGSALAALAGLFGGVAAQMGDLFASLVKRHCKVKDFGTIFPGHGGMMDRMDSILFTSIVIFCYRAILLGLL